MTLSKLLEGVAVTKMLQKLYGQHAVTQEIQIDRLHYDSRKIGRNDVFVAIFGNSFDGHKFIDSAVANGAKVVVVEHDTAMPDSFFMHAGVVKIVVSNSRIALARMSANYFDRPSEKLSMIGVTGTNGKTTTAYLIKSILEYCGIKSGLLGTIEYKIGDTVIPATHTTPESLELNEMLNAMIQSGCQSAVMEVSSHALHQHRVHGIDFKAAVFTNLTQDHLDYHLSMDGYFKAKNMLFGKLASGSCAIVNRDDEYGKNILEKTPARTISYGITIPADVSAKDISLSMNGMTFTIVHQGEETAIESQLTGRFNVSNILAAFGTGIALGINKKMIQAAIRETHAVRGRFEQITSSGGWTAVIDYAHTPDALEKTLRALKDVFDSSKNGKIITVFGCGGNRDRSKRSQMGLIASSLSDVTVITSDNPRFETPESIIDEVMQGIKKGSTVFRDSDRKEAINKALGLARKGDVILVAGKGHEDYQVIEDRKIHFSDRETIEEYLRAHP